MLSNEELIKLNDSLPAIYTSIRDALKSQVDRMDLVELTKLDFDKNVVSFKTEIYMDVRMEDILKSLK